MVGVRDEHENEENAADENRRHRDRPS